MSGATATEGDVGLAIPLKPSATPTGKSINIEEGHQQRSSSMSTSLTASTYVGDTSSDEEAGNHRLCNSQDGQQSDPHDPNDESPNDAIDVGAIERYFSEAHINHANEAAEKENEGLNLNLGLPLDLTVFTRRDDSVAMGFIQRILRLPIRILIRLLDRFLAIIETPLFQCWSEKIPLRWRQKVTFLVWGLYLPVHKALIGRRTGLHRDVSLEYHAMTSVMWWGRLFPVTVKRMRMSLSQLHVWHPPEQYPEWDSIANSSPGAAHDIFIEKPSNGDRYGIRGHLYEVYHRMEHKRTTTGFSIPAKEFASSAEMTVTGQYIQHASQPSRKVIFWIYGGAFLAGDSKGNMGIAEKMGMLCADDEGGMRDVFIPDYRLVPESHLDDAIHDCMMAYEYLIYERGVRPEDMTLVGISSGGGLVVLLLQALAKAKQDYCKKKGNCETGDNENIECVPMPAGGVLIGPFVDYTEPKGSMKEFVKHDLIVNQSVYDEGIPYLELVLGSHTNRVRASPVYGNFEGLPPLCICVSRHEVVYDQSMLLAERAKAQGVDVTVGVWKYMCHVFPLLCPFLPQGRESFQFMSEWIKER